jgi:hypothetical protein
MDTCVDSFRMLAGYMVVGAMLIWQMHCKTDLPPAKYSFRLGRKLRALILLH